MSLVEGGPLSAATRAECRSSLERAWEVGGRLRGAGGRVSPDRVLAQSRRCGEAIIILAIGLLDCVDE